MGGVSKSLGGGIRILQVEAEFGISRVGLESSGGGVRMIWGGVSIARGSA